MKRCFPVWLIGRAPLLIACPVTSASALIMVFFRATAIDFAAVFLCIVMMSISGLFYIIAGQFIFAKTLLLLPVSGYESGWKALQFLILPVAVGVISGIGAGSRWYRTICLEESGQDYVRTARAKGLSESAVLVRHILRNALIPSTWWSFALVHQPDHRVLFHIPGLGSYTVGCHCQSGFCHHPSSLRAFVHCGFVAD